MKRALAAVLLLAASGCGTRVAHHDVVAAVGRGAAAERSAAAMVAGTDSMVTSSDAAAPAGGLGDANEESPPGTARGLQVGTTARVAHSTRSTTLSPVLLASVGTQSGPIGAVLIGNVQGAQAWVKHINDKGGLDGHPVHLVVVDDGADPARHRAAVQQAIEKDKVIAFLQNDEAFSGNRTTAAYITAKRVPVIGSDTGQQYFYEFPMFFPQAASGNPLIDTALAGSAQQARARGKRRLGTLVCTEAQICTDADRIWAQAAAGLGLESVYRGKASLAQPDFTAECLAARSAGVELFQISLDTNSVIRVAAACARQNFHPIFAFGASIVADRMKDDPNLSTAVATSNVFPYFQRGTPAADEFQAAMRKYGPGFQLGVAQATGWTSAKLLERAAQHLPEPPTSAAILAGLWSLRNETLGGLTHPLTFTPERPASQLRCWFNIAIAGGEWTSPDAFQLHCR